MAPAPPAAPARFAKCDKANARHHDDLARQSTHQLGGPSIGVMSPETPHRSRPHAPEVKRHQ